MIEVVGLDGDDTLWHSESIFAATHERLEALLAPYVDAETLQARLLDTERRNLRLFGYGVKAFTLSTIETAIEVTNGGITADEIQAILDFGKELLDHPVQLLDGVAEAIAGLDGKRLVLITKGDLFHQEAKVAGSGLGDRFSSIEIVSEKDERTYRRILDDLDVAADRFLMAGNSLRSDVAPVVALGGYGVHVPYTHEWALDSTPDDDLPDERWWQLDSIAALPALVARLDA